MNAQELINKLEKLPKEYEILLVNSNSEFVSEENIWLNDVEVSYMGQSGYKDEGEIRFIGSE